MRVVHLLGWYFPSSVGGTEIYVRELARLQRAAGQDVLIAAPDATLDRPFSYEHDGVPVFRYPVPDAPTRDEAQGLVRARGAEQFADWIERMHPAVVHAHGLVTGLGLFELEAARRTGARVVVTHHLPGLGFICRNGLLMERRERPCDGAAAPVRCAECVLRGARVPGFAADLVARTPMGLSARLARVRGPAGTALGLRHSVAHAADQQRRLFEIADAQVVLTEAARRIFAANGLPLDRVFVNRLAVSGGPYVRKRIQPIDGRPVRFGALCRFDPAKGLTELVRAARRIDPAVAFTLDIRGPLLTAADRRYAAELDLLIAGDHRLSVGAGPEHRDVPLLLASLDVLCSVPTGFENGPTVALEALAVGTPVLATAVGNQPEIISDGVNGRLVAPGDEHALADAIEAIVRRPEQIAEWQRHAGEVRRMEDVAREYDGLYARLLSRAAA